LKNVVTPETKDPEKTAKTGGRGKLYRCTESKSAKGRKARCVERSSGGEDHRERDAEGKNRGKKRRKKEQNRRSMRLREERSPGG